MNQSHQTSFCVPRCGPRCVGGVIGYVEAMDKDKDGLLSLEEAVSSILDAEEGVELAQHPEIKAEQEGVKLGGKICFLQQLKEFDVSEGGFQKGSRRYHLG